VVDAVVYDYFFTVAGGETAETVSLDAWSMGSLSNASTVLSLIERSRSEITAYWTDAAQGQH
jgi:hypothetical protein